jgi:hypothetical protein
MVMSGPKGATGVYWENGGVLLLPSPKVARFINYSESTSPGRMGQGEMVILILLK